MVAQSQDSLNFRALDIGKTHFHDFCDEERVIKNIFSSQYSRGRDK